LRAFRDVCHWLVLYGWRKPSSTRPIAAKYSPDQHLALVKIKLWTVREAATESMIVLKEHC
jgi:hypothetical protein